MFGAATPAQVEVDGRQVRVTNVEKVLYPATGTTKGEVIAYYHHVSPWMLPHVTGRPATRKRWPNGVGTGPEADGAFFQKGLDHRSTPDWVATAVLEHDDGPKTYPLINNAATLVWLAQLAALELHVPQWCFDPDGTRQQPDRLVLDLDPGPGATMGQCVELAHLIKEVLHGAGMTCHPVTSGSKGIHLYSPLDGSLTSEAASEFAHQLARSLEGMRPDLVVSEMKKSAREGKVLLDWSQNNGNKTTIAPYSLRGR
ncbi:MAG: non-homologous end-joining DNA ligase, partial [Arachnia sp.]